MAAEALIHIVRYFLSQNCKICRTLNFNVLEPPLNIIFFCSNFFCYVLSLNGTKSGVQTVKKEEFIFFICFWTTLTYKLCTLMYRVFNGTARQYLAELCQICSDDRLQSALCQDYVVAQTYKRLADSSFSVAGPTAWNSSPAEFCCTSTYSSFVICIRLQTFFLCFIPVTLYFTHCIFR